ncbi:MAG: type II toxin-antitoxin system VapC family toxin [Deltaproteobacteria bacterium]|nr:type II toxin-antitoxin system VapC family toxin [Deltaproteobacteria bacterium]
MGQGTSTTGVGAVSDASPLLVDTDILIDAGRAAPTALQFLNDKYPGALAVCVITRMELIVGCRNKAELRVLDSFLRGFRVFALTPDISQQAEALLRRYRLSHGLLIPDALIAATALGADIPLATKNVSDFRFIEGLALVDYG